MAYPPPYPPPQGGPPLPPGGYPPQSQEYPNPGGGYVAPLQSYPPPPGGYPIQGQQSQAGKPDKCALILLFIFCTVSYSSQVAINLRYLSHSQFVTKMVRNVELTLGSILDYVSYSVITFMEHGMTLSKAPPISYLL